MSDDSFRFDYERYDGGGVYLEPGDWQGLVDWLRGHGVDWNESKPKRAVRARARRGELRDVPWTIKNGIQVAESLEKLRKIRLALAKTVEDGEEGLGELARLDGQIAALEWVLKGDREDMEK